MKFRFTLLAFWLILVTATGQEKKLAMSGYVKDLFFYFHPVTKFPGVDSYNLYSSILHNRLNFKWFAGEKLTFAVEMRNRMLFGTMIRDLPFYKSTIDFDPGYFDLAAEVASGDTWFIHTMVDRAWMEYTTGKWQVTLGRQRINWGLNLVWNPNDIFNTFSYFDFDYEERPGSDALRLKYYTGATSSAELAFKAWQTTDPVTHEKKDESTMAGLYRFSAWKYDFQFIAGKTGPDYVAGTGWSGDILGGAFRGEISWFVPKEKDSGSKEAVVASLSGDYTFRNSLYLHGGFLFNSIGKTGKSGSMSLFEQNLTAKTLTLSRYSIFFQASYPITPVFSVSASSIANPTDGSFYIGPSTTLSIGNNFELLLNGQLFFGEKGSEYGNAGKAAFARLKWAF